MPYPEKGGADAGRADFYRFTSAITIYDGTWPQGAPVPEGTAFSLGDLLRGSTHTRTFSLHNAGVVPLTVSGVRVEGARAAAVSIAPLKTSSLAPGAATPLVVTIHANNDGLFDATIVIDNGTPGEPDPSLHLTALVNSTAQVPQISMQPVASFLLNDPNAEPLQVIDMAAAARGTQPLTYQWRRNGKAIKGANNPVYQIRQPGRAHAATYTLEVRNAYGVATSRPVEVAYLLPLSAVKNIIVNEGASVTLTAPVLGHAPTSWSVASPQNAFDGTGGQIFGSGTERLTFRQVRAADAGDYSATLGGTTLLVARLRVRPLPQLDTVAIPPDREFEWKVGGRVSVGPFFTADDSTRYFASGLPPGITVNARTGVLSGQPAAAGYYHPVLWAHSTAGSSPRIAIATHVAPLKPGLLGTRRGLVDREETINQGLGGSITLTVSPNGALTGTVKLGQAVHVLAGRFDTPPNELEAELTARLPLKLKTGKTMEVILTEGLRLTGRIQPSGSAAGSFAAFVTERQEPPSLIVNDPAGRYNAALTVATTQGAPAPPSTPGYLQIGGARTGFTWSGKLADGTAFSGSSPVLLTQDNAAFALPLHHVLYQSTGCLMGWVKVTRANEGVSGELEWTKALIQRTGTSWPDGFGDSTLTVAGGPYIPPAPGYRVMEMEGVDLDFEVRGLVPASDYDLDTWFSLSSAHVATRDPNALPQVATNLAITANTGFFTGTFFTSTFGTGGNIPAEANPIGSPIIPGCLAAYCPSNGGTA